MGRRAFMVVVAALVGGTTLTACADIAGPAAVPADFSTPRELPVSDPLAMDRLAFNSDRTGSHEVFTMSKDGSYVRQLTDDETYDSFSPRVSPDRRTIIFHRSPAGVHDRDYSKVSLWAMAADGHDLVELRPPGLDGWATQGHAEFSPDGEHLVMFGGSVLNPQVHVTDGTGQNPQPLTSRGGVNIDPAFSPDGSLVAFVGCPASICRESDYEIYLLPLLEGTTEPAREPVRVTADDLRDNDPYFSPDGRRLVWLTAFEPLGGGASGLGEWDLRVGNADGSDARRLFDDRGVTSRPAFSADGRWLFTHRLTPGAARFDVWRVPMTPDGPDASGATPLTADQDGSNEYPAA